MHCCKVNSFPFCGGYVAEEITSEGTLWGRQENEVKKMESSNGLIMPDIDVNSVFLETMSLFVSY